MPALLIALAVSVLLQTKQTFFYAFQDPIDGLSLRMEMKEEIAEVSGWDGRTWSPWEPLSLENEQDPTLQESNMVLFARPMTRVQIKARGSYVLHPIRISKAPLGYSVASHRIEQVEEPRIYSRKDWGADESLLYGSDEVKEPVNEEEHGNGNGNVGQEEEPSNRIRDCEEAQKNFPEEFTRAKRVTQGPNGKRLVWPQEYSPEMKLFVVHHTALKVEGDPRPGVERMRALYAYHAKNRGWGDVGYHFLIDEEGRIYEGRTGGDYVVGGHVYCNNVGTIGIAMLGNFDLERPPPEQTQSLQWLLDQLAKQYEIDLAKDVQFHGKLLPVIVGHRALVSTDCPGYYVWQTLRQIRTNVRNGNLDMAILYPTLSKKKPTKATVEKTATRSASKVTRRTATLSRKIRRAERERAHVSPPRDNTMRPVQRQKSVPRPTFQIPKQSPKPATQESSIRIRLTREEKNLTSCNASAIEAMQKRFRGSLTCDIEDTMPRIINTLLIEDYLLGLAEEPDSEPFEKQRAFAIAARSYAAYYMENDHRKFPDEPYDGSDDPAVFQAYGGIVFEKKNPRWAEAVESTVGMILTYKGEIIRAPYFSSDDGRTRSPEEAGWQDFPFAEILESKPDPWCDGMLLRGHGVGMSGCGAEGQAKQGKTAEEILEYYYPGTVMKRQGTFVEAEQ